MQRQAAVLRAGGQIKQETRHFQEECGATTSGRSKEEATTTATSRSPTSSPSRPTAAWIEELRATLPEVPSVRRARLQSDWGITDKDMESMLNAGAIDLVEETVALGVDQAAARKWWMGELARKANTDGVELSELPVTPEHVARVDEALCVRRR